MIMDLRDARQPIDREELHRLLDLLLDLRERTHPDTCTAPASVPVIDPPPTTTVLGGDAVKVEEVFRGKNDCAIWAAHQTARLAVSTAGWAFNHLLGRAVSEASADPDAHDHERSGEAEATTQDRLYDNVAARAASRELLSALASLMPTGLAVQLRQALEALEHGETMPILEPSRTGRHGKPYALSMAKKALIELAHFRHGSGTPLNKSYEAIGKAVSLSPNAIQNWDLRDIPKAMGDDAARKFKALARLAGDYAAKRDVDPEWWRGEVIDGLAEMTADRLSATSIADLAARYRQANANEGR